MAHDASSALELDDDNPWPGLASYDEVSTRFFHGREADSAELLRLVRLAPLVTLYGKSGLGKSSMLQAGVFPTLRQERWLPVYLRLDYGHGSRLSPLEQARLRLLEEIKANQLDAPDFEAAEGLWAYLQRNDRPIWTADNYPVTPVLVFDQFEEVFSRGGSPEHVKTILNSMGDLVAGRVPAELLDDRKAAKRLNLQAQQYHVVLSFRSDFLADVESWAKDANLPRRESLHLQAMKRDAAIEAVQRAGKAVLADGMATDIVDFLLQREGGEGTARATDVEPVLLSLCCYQLNVNRQRESLPKINKSLLLMVGEGILKGFYQEAMNGLDPRVPRFVEENLIQGDRFRSSYPLAGALIGQADAQAGKAGLTEEELDRLTGSRLLRVDPQGGELRIELIHDRLVGVVRESRDARRAIEQQKEALAEEEKQKRLSASESERKKLRMQRAVMAGVLTAALIGWLGAFYLYRVAAEETRKAKDESKAQKETSELLNQRIDKLQGELDKSKVEATEARVESAEAQVKLVEAKPGGAAPAKQQEAKAQLTVARNELEQAKVQKAAAAPTAPSAANDPKQGDGVPQSRTYADWRLSSGGCKDGATSVTSKAVFTVTEQPNTISIRSEYSAQDGNYTVSGKGTLNNGIKSAAGYYDIDTQHEWKRGAAVAFTTTGVDRVYVANGKPTRVSLLKIRTSCPGG